MWAAVEGATGYQNSASMSCSGSKQPFCRRVGATTNQDRSERTSWLWQRASS
jgi:hypothetical protein